MKSAEVLRRKEVERITSVSRSTLYAWCRRGLFPRPIQLGPRAVGWRAEEVHAWLAQRPLALGD